GDPLGVRVDGVTIDIVANALVAIGGGGGAGNVTAATTLNANSVLLGDGTTAVKSTTTGTGVVTALAVNTGTSGAFVVQNGALGTPSSGTLTSATGLPVSTGLTGAGTGVLTALGVNVGSAGAVLVNGGALGTPSSGTLTSVTGLPEAGLSLTDITTHNASTSKHGFLPKLDNNASHFLNGQGGFTTPTGSGAPQILAAYAAKTANYTVDLSTDGTIELTNNAATITLPTAVEVDGPGVILKNLQTSNALTINTTSAQTV